MQIGYPPGWYPDPNAPGWQRWWNGLEWEGQPAPAPQVPAPPGLAPYGASPATKAPFLGRQEWMWIGAGLGTVLLLMIVAVIASAVGPDERSLPWRTSTTTTSTSPVAATAAPTTAAADVPPEPAPPTAAPTTKAPATTAAPAPKTNAAEAARGYLDEGFASTSWYPHIKTITVQGSALWIDTDLYPDIDAIQPARGICSAVSGFIITRPELGLLGVRVAAADGQRLAIRTSMSASDECID